MRPRAFTALASLSPSKLCSALSQGMALIAEHVATLSAAAAAENGPGGARATAAVSVVADEEAAKYLILLDAARAARLPAEIRSRQLRRCSLHIPKGVYAEVVDIRPDRFDELIGYVDSLRVTHYLDGPNDVDWVFRNRVEESREDRLYVDPVSYTHLTLPTNREV